MISQLLPDNNGTHSAPLTRALIPWLRKEIKIKYILRSRHIFNEPITCSYELVLQYYFATSFAKSHNFQRHSYMPLWHKVVWLATRRKVPENEQPISNQFKVFQKETVILVIREKKNNNNVKITKECYATFPIFSQIKLTAS